MLQGSLDDFSLNEVLGLLSSTTKSGRLRLSGDRGTGSLWIDGGYLTAAEASRIPGKTGIEDVMFEMLRFDQGTFSFMVDETPANGLDPEEVDFVLALAQDRLVEWRSIEAIVPSLAHMVHLADDLNTDEVIIGRDEWKTIIAVGEGSAVSPVCKSLDLDEVDGSRRLKEMVERGLLAVSEPDGPAQTSSAVVADSNVAKTIADPVGDPAEVISDNDSGGSQISAGISDASAEERPPMPAPPIPAPPSPAEIESFSSGLDEASPFESGELLDDALMGVQEGGDSVLMRYLKSDS